MKCIQCGHEHDAIPASGSNSGRIVNLPVPEEFLPILAQSLREKSTQARMWGMGSLANALGGFIREFSGEIPDWLKGFEADGWARVLDAHNNGWTMTCVIDPDNERRIAVVGTSPDGQKDLVLASRFCRKDADPDRDLVRLEEFFDRRMPRLRTAEGAEESPVRNP